MATAEEHLQELLKLPVEERARVVRLLLESLEPNEDPEESPQRAEILRRLRSIEDGTALLVDGDEVRRQVRERLHQVSSK